MREEHPSYELEEFESYYSWKDSFTMKIVLNVSNNLKMFKITIQIYKRGNFLALIVQIYKDLEKARKFEKLEDFV